MCSTMRCFAARELNCKVKRSSGQEDDSARQFGAILRQLCRSISLSRSRSTNSFISPLLRRTLLNSNFPPRSILLPVWSMDPLGCTRVCRETWVSNKRKEREIVWGKRRRITDAYFSFILNFSFFFFKLNLRFCVKERWTRLTMVDSSWKNSVAPLWTTILSELVCELEKYWV